RHRCGLVEIGGQVVERLLPTTDEHYRCALDGEGGDGRPADPARSSGHDAGAIFEAQVHQHELMTSASRATPRAIAGSGRPAYPTISPAGASRSRCVARPSTPTPSSWAAVTTACSGIPDGRSTSANRPHATPETCAAGNESLSALSSAARRER